MFILLDQLVFSICVIYLSGKVCTVLNILMLWTTISAFQDKVLFFSCSLYFHTLLPTDYLFVVQSVFIILTSFFLFFYTSFFQTSASDTKRIIWQHNQFRRSNRADQNTHTWISSSQIQLRSWFTLTFGTQVRFSTVFLCFLFFFLVSQSFVVLCLVGCLLARLYKKWYSLPCGAWLIWRDEWRYVEKLIGEPGCL